jgi:hypothetical protein
VLWSEVNPRTAHEVFLAVALTKLVENEILRPHEDVEGCDVLQGLLVAKIHIDKAIEQYHEER